MTDPQPSNWPERDWLWEPPAPTVKEIINAVASYNGHKISARDIRGRCRQKAHANARHLAMWLCRHLRPDMSFPAIAKEFDRDHTSIIYAVEKMDLAMNGRSADEVWRGMKR